MSARDQVRKLVPGAVCRWFQFNEDEGGTSWWVYPTQNEYEACMGHSNVSMEQAWENALTYISEQLIEALQA